MDLTDVQLVSEVSSDAKNLLVGTLVKVYIFGNFKNRKKKHTKALLSLLLLLSFWLCGMHWSSSVFRSCPYSILHQPVPGHTEPQPRTNPCTAIIAASAHNYPKVRLQRQLSQYWESTGSHWSLLPHLPAFTDRSTQVSVNSPGFNQKKYFLFSLWRTFSHYRNSSWKSMIPVLNTTWKTMKRQDNCLVFWSH